MNILLVGEYSRLHNSLKEGLIKLGHNVVIIGFNDGFKNYPVDYPIVLKWNSSFPKKSKLEYINLPDLILPPILLINNSKNIN
ncbi:hypothetical protein ACFQZF_11895 [Flavobacterium myungsuense]|uniref:hypothetical protein n=1 Tax=Flavobacterium myungsuense TaxID=651823 RepID=UPI00362A6F9E